MKPQTANSFMACQRWIGRPDFLRKPKQDWPEQYDLPLVSSEDPEVKCVLLMNVINAEMEEPTIRLMNSFSSWTKLKISVAWFLRLKGILLQLSRKRKDLASASPIPPARLVEEMKKARVGLQTLSVCDLVRAETAIVCYSQHTTFKEEIGLQYCRVELWRRVRVTSTG